jgi:hypothetical protein
LGGGCKGKGMGGGGFVLPEAWGSIETLRHRGTEVGGWAVCAGDFFWDGEFWGEMGSRFVVRLGSFGNLAHLAQEGEGREVNRGDAEGAEGIEKV